MSDNKTTDPIKFLKAHTLNTLAAMPNSVDAKDKLFLIAEIERLRVRVMADSNTTDDDPRTSTPGTTDTDFLRDAVRCAVPRHSRGWQPRWVAVMQTLSCGSGYACALCRRFGFNPDEKVRA